MCWRRCRHQQQSECNSWVTHPWILWRAPASDQLGCRIEKYSLLKTRDRTLPVVFPHVSSFVRPHQPLDPPKAYILICIRIKSCAHQASGDRDPKRSRCGCCRISDSYGCCDAAMRKGCHGKLLTAITLISDIFIASWLRWRKTASMTIPSSPFTSDPRRECCLTLIGTAQGLPWKEAPYFRFLVPHVSVAIWILQPAHILSMGSHGLRDAPCRHCWIYMRACRPWYGGWMLFERLSCRKLNLCEAICTENTAFHDKLNHYIVTQQDKFVWH